MVAQTAAVDAARDRLLRSVLVLDAVVSGITGAGMVAGSGPVARFLGIEPGWVPAVIGIGLLGWAALLLIVSRKREISTGAVREIIAGNIAWVAGSYLILLLAVPELTTEGSWALGIVAEGVGLFALLQYLGLRRAGD